ncbi:MAG: rhomboid family intramembrane serine protease [bacterium]|nr:rhomboid family intramembrane serine protease [bacterium]
MRQTSAPVTIAIVLTNCLVFIYVHTMLDGAREVQRFLYDYGLNFTEFWIHQKVWQPLTSMFLHTDLAHFAFNMLAVWSVGTPLEMTLNSGRFTFLYFISGFTGSLFLLIFNADSNAPAIGASGAAFGLLGALAVFYPKARLLVFFIPMRAITAAAILAVLSIGFYLFQQLTFIAHMAHLGGLVGGLLYSKFALGLAIGRSDLNGATDGTIGGGAPGAVLPGSRSTAPGGSGGNSPGLLDRIRGAAGPGDADASGRPKLSRADRAAKEAEILRLMRGISDEPASQDTGVALPENQPQPQPSQGDVRQTTPSQSAQPQPASPQPKQPRPASPPGSAPSEPARPLQSSGSPAKPAGKEKADSQPEAEAGRGSAEKPAEGSSRRLEYDPETGRFRIKE